VILISSPLFPLLLASPILLITILFDLRLMRIPDPITLALLALFILIVPWTVTAPELASRVGLGLICLVLGFIAFAFGKIGGGDVKILAALMLLIPVNRLSLFLLIFALCLILGVAVILLIRAGFANPASRWKFLRSREFPMGISIAGAGLVLPALLFASAG
jgi:prepilin peptidase CpaA